MPPYRTIPSNEEPGFMTLKPLHLEGLIILNESLGR
jgi:hypothetical protein